MRLAFWTGISVHPAPDNAAKHRAQKAVNRVTKKALAVLRKDTTYAAVITRDAEGRIHIHAFSEFQLRHLPKDNRKSYSRYTVIDNSYTKTKWGEELVLFLDEGWGDGQDLYHVWVVASLYRHVLNAMTEKDMIGDVGKLDDGDSVIKSVFRWGLW